MVKTFKGEDIYKLSIPIQFSFNKRKKVMNGILDITKKKIKITVYKNSKSKLMYSLKDDDIDRLEKYLYKCTDNQYTNPLSNKYDKDFDDTKFTITLDHKRKMTNNDNSNMISNIHMYFYYKQKKLLNLYINLLKMEDNGYECFR